MESCIINIEDDNIVHFGKTNTVYHFKTKQNMKSFITIFLLAFNVCTLQSGIFSRKTTNRSLELEKNRDEAKKLMKEIKTISNNILQQDESLLPSNITTHDVNALLALSAGLQGYEMLKKFFEKGAAPPNSVGNINATNVKLSQVQYKDVDVGNITIYNNTVYNNNYTVRVPCTHVLAKNKLSRGRKRKSLN